MHSGPRRRPGPSWRRWFLGRLLAPATLTALVALVVAGLIFGPADDPGVREMATVLEDEAAWPDAFRGVDSLPFLEDDGTWAFVASLAEDLDWDNEAGEDLFVVTGTAERMAIVLSIDEQQELARLLRAELRRPQS
jgi:hypothetical protein